MRHALHPTVLSSVYLFIWEGNMQKFRNKKCKNRENTEFKSRHFINQIDFYSHYYFIGVCKELQGITKNNLYILLILKLKILRKRILFVDFKHCILSLHFFFSIFQQIYFQFLHFLHSCIFPSWFPSLNVHHAIHRLRE